MGSHHVLALFIVLRGSMNTTNSGCVWGQLSTFSHLEVTVFPTGSLWLLQRALVLWGHGHWHFGHFTMEPSLRLKGRELPSPLHFHGWNEGGPRAGCQEGGVWKSSLGAGGWVGIGAQAQVGTEKFVGHRMEQAAAGSLTPERTAAQP